MFGELKLIRVVPSYGRDYRSKEAALRDWYLNQDFTIVWGRQSGRQINRTEANQLGLEVQIRYWRNQRLTEVIQPEGVGQSEE
tara:strand:- start:53 stop:301 length:249 start_codon:yes stop_codon:yes gene_type:complete